MLTLKDFKKVVEPEGTFYKTSDGVKLSKEDALALLVINNYQRDKKVISEIKIQGLARMIEDIERMKRLLKKK